MMVRILVVEDNPVFAQVTCNVLRRVDGYEPEPVRTAEAALEYLQSHHADLVLVDILLPGHDGVWLIRQLSARQPDLPAIVFSGLDHYYVTQSLQAGARGYVLKEDLSGLLEGIQTALRGGTYLSKALNEGDEPPQSR